MSFDLIAAAHAAETAAVTAAPPAASGADTFMQFAPLLAILALMYFLLIRPQQKRLDDHQKLIKGIRRGDRVVTGGGVYGTVTKLEGDDIVVVEIAENVRVRVQRGSISAVVGSPDAVANSNDPGKSKSA